MGQLIFITNHIYTTIMMVNISLNIVSWFEYRQCLFSGVQLSISYPDSNFQGAHMGPTWDLSAPMNLAIRLALVWLIALRRQTGEPFPEPTITQTYEPLGNNQLNIWKKNHLIDSWSNAILLKKCENKILKSFILCQSMLGNLVLSDDRGSFY